MLKKLSVPKADNKAMNITYEKNTPQRLDLSAHIILALPTKNVKIIASHFKDFISK